MKPKSFLLYSIAFSLLLLIYFFWSLYTATPCPAILLYHEISPNNGIITPEIFAAQLDYLAENGFRTIGLKELASHLEGRHILSNKDILLTFDDGYLDNWVYAWPELKKRNMKALFFILPGHTKEGKLRKINDNPEGENMPDCKMPFMDIWAGKQSDYFMNWDELRALKNSSLVEIASHGWKHNYIPTENKVLDFNTPFAKSKKQWPFYPLPVEGAPLFRVGYPYTNKALIVKEEAILDLSNWYKENAFLKIDSIGAGINEILSNRWKDTERSCEDLYRFESDDEFFYRIKNELKMGKLLMEKELGDPINALCWPWGAYDELSLKAAKEVGFKLFFTTQKGTVLPGDSFESIKRMNVERDDIKWFSSRLKWHTNSFVVKQYAKVYRKI